MDDYLEPLNINIQNQLVWISVPNFEFENIEIIISYFSTDVNQDGIWDVLDIVLVVGYIMNTTILSESQQTSADLNEDGNINVLDIVEILNIIF